MTEAGIVDRDVSMAVKPRYELLDGLRGVAAMVVIWYHVFEAFATSSMDQDFNHGYLAVDFFFMLSGFVIGYAYDDRWKQNRITVKGFIRRRLIRLHPMVLMGVALGVIAFAVQGFVQWDGSPVSGKWVMVSALLACLFVPAYPGAGYEVRGNGEAFPLNGPAWSLFFEYIGNVLYALWLRKLGTNALAAVVVLNGVGLVAYAVGNMSGGNHLGVGWSLGDYNFLGGMLRLGFAFSAGLLMSRVFRPVKVRGAFWICSIAIVALLAMPFVGWSDGTLWLNGLYDALCVTCVFPVILYVGASGQTTDRRSYALCDFLGRISYPVYIVHYPLMYLFYSWVWDGGFSFGQAWPVACVIFVASILLAAVCLKYYDEPLRRRLASVNKAVGKAVSA